MNKGKQVGRWRSLRERRVGEARGLEEGGCMRDVGEPIESNSQGGREGTTFPVLRVENEIEMVIEGLT